MMIYPSWTVAKNLVRDVNTRSTIGITAVAAVAALVMTAWDLVMDPGMAAAGNWIWEQGGAYFGVPVHNYFGWLLTTFLVYVGRGLAVEERGTRERYLAHFPSPPDYRLCVLRASLCDGRR